MKVDRSARIIVPIMFITLCTVMLTVGLTHNEEIKVKPGHEIVYLDTRTLVM